MVSNMVVRLMYVRVLAVLLVLLAHPVLLDVARGQADGRVHQYMFNQLDFNPGFAGSAGFINLYANARKDWVGFGEGAPLMVQFSFDMPFGYRPLNRMVPGRKVMVSHAAGVHFVRDQLGLMATNGLELSYALRLHLRALGHLSFGLGFRGLNDKFDAKWRTPDGATADTSIPAGNSSSISMDLSAGVYFNTKAAYFGLSAGNLLGPDVRNSLSKAMGQKERMDYARQYYVVGGYNLALRPEWSVEPGAMIRSDLTEYAYSFTTRVTYDNLIWLGVNYYISTSIGAYAGVRLFNGLRLGYSYDYPLTVLRHFTSGSHEVFVSYTFSLRREKVPEQYKSIRFL